MKEKKMTREIIEKDQKKKEKIKKAEIQKGKARTAIMGEQGDQGPQGPRGLPGYMFGYRKKDRKRMKKEEKKRMKQEKKLRIMEKKLNEILLWCEEENYSVKDVKHLANCLKSGAEEQRVKHKKAKVGIWI